MKRLPRTLGLFVLLLLTSSRTFAQGEIGHFAPAVLSIRDFTMPDSSGVYGLLYSFNYSTTRLNDPDGNEIDIISIHPGPGPGVNIDLDVDVNIGVLAPTFVWVSPFKILGARYGAYISIAMSNSSIGAATSNSLGTGRNAETGQFGLADLYLQPLWLSWGKERWQFAFGYGFYAPIGKYEVETVTLPVVGDISAEAPDNIGLGFWTHQLQGAISIWPWTDKRMAVVNAFTYEMNGKKKDFDITAGNNLSWNWGVSQYLPLKKDFSWLLEIGPTGYGSWQVSDDTGADAKSPASLDEVHGAGGQVGLTQTKWNAVLNFHYFWEFSSKDRFQGNAMGLNLALKF